MNNYLDSPLCNVYRFLKSMYGFRFTKKVFLDIIKAYFVWIGHFILNLCVNNDPNTEMPCL